MFSSIPSFGRGTSTRLRHRVGGAAERLGRSRLDRPFARGDASRTLPLWKGIKKTLPVSEHPGLQHRDVRLDFPSSLTSLKIDQTTSTRESGEREGPNASALGG